MKRKMWNRLRLNRETVRALTDASAAQALGAGVEDNATLTLESPERCCVTITAPPLNQSGGCSKGCVTQDCCSNGRD